MTQAAFADNSPQRFHALEKPHEGPALIVFGNEKGGSGKSTAAIGIAIALLYRGYRVGTIDLDARQGTMTRYLRNRYLHAGRSARAYPSPLHMPIDRSAATTTQGQRADEMAFLTMAMEELGGVCDFIVIDTPGADTHLNRLAHGLGDVLITPLNDSLIDLDVLATLDPESGAIIAPSFYTRHVHELLSAKAAQMGRDTDWIVMRNRLSPLDNAHKRRMHDALSQLSRDHGFRLASGFGERLIYRDLFLQGLTIADLAHDPNHPPLTPSQRGAWAETEALMAALKPERFK